MRMALTRWNPTPDLARDRFSRLIEDAFNDMLRPISREENLASRSWTPAVDIRETAEALTLAMDLPGLRKEDVNITLENNVLTVAGERKLDSEQTNDTYHRIERAYGAFTRSFTLAPTVSGEKVAADFKDGVLTITLPKVEESKPRKIDIR